MATNRICMNCGKHYRYCPNCKQDIGKPSWYNAFCSENCKNLFEGAVNYSSKGITDDQAKEIIAKADLTNKDKFNHGVVDFINKFSISKDKTIEEKKEETNIGKEIVSEDKTDIEVKPISNTFTSFDKVKKPNKRRIERNKIDSEGSQTKNLDD